MESVPQKATARWNGTQDHDFPLRSMSRVIVPSLATSAGSGPAQAADDMAPSPVESCLWWEGSVGGQCGPQATQEGCAFRASLTTWAESLAGEGLGSWPELSHGREPQNHSCSYGLVGLPAGLTYQGRGFLGRSSGQPFCIR